MSRKHVVRYPLFAALPATTTQTSIAVSTSEMDKASIHVKVAAGNTGTLSVMVLNSDNKESTNYYELNFGSALTVSSGDTDIHIVIQEMPFSWMKLVWTPTSGTGTITAVLLQKSQGA